MVFRRSWISGLVNGVDFNVVCGCRWCCMFSWHRDTCRHEVEMFPSLWSYWSIRHNLTSCYVVLFLSFLFGAMHLKELENEYFLAGPPPKAALRTAAVRFSKQRNLNYFFDSFLFSDFSMFTMYYRFMCTTMYSECFSLFRVVLITSVFVITRDVKVKKLDDILCYKKIT